VNCAAWEARVASPSQTHSTTPSPLTTTLSKGVNFRKRLFLEGW